MDNLVFHIGFHKTGTTWLQSGLFREHPEIELIVDYSKPWYDPFLQYLIGSSDRHFTPKRCRAILQEQIKKIRKKRNPRILLVSSERLSGHPYSGGYDSIRLAERISESFPQSCVIMAVRNQVDMLVSIYKQFVRDGYVGTFSELINTKRWQTTGFSMEMYEYDTVIHKYHSLFSKNRALVLLYEDLKSDKHGYLEKITDFLEVKHFVPSNIDALTNPSLADQMIAARRMLNNFRSTELHPFPLVLLKDSFLDILERVIAPFCKHSRLILEDDLQKIRMHFQTSNERLRALLGFPLRDYP